MPRRIRVRPRRGSPEADVEVVEKPAEAEAEPEGVETPTPESAPAEEKAPQADGAGEGQQEAEPERRPSPALTAAMQRLPEHQRDAFAEAVRLVGDIAEQHARRCVERGEALPFPDDHAGVLLLARRCARGTS